MERSEIRDSSLTNMPDKACYRTTGQGMRMKPDRNAANRVGEVPDFASLHPGYDF